MIGSVTGILVAKKPPNLLVQVGGLGYEIVTSMHSAFQLPQLEQSITLFTDFIIREDSHSLYGFTTQAERDLFRCLVKVSGVGPKLAIGLLSELPYQDLHFYLNTGDVARLQKIRGVGKKTAERLALELREKLPNVAMEDLITNPSARDDATDALVALGYKPQEAKKVVRGIQGDELSSEELIKAALKALA